jgi:predicted  nucleic acid-binding Zn-ribbon protein
MPHDTTSELLELQSVDIELNRLTKLIDELPEKQEILAARAKAREISALRGKAEQLVHQLEAEVKKRQDETAMLKERMDGEQKKLMETSDHRAVQAITREMDGFRRRSDKVDMETLQFMERAEKAASQVSTIEEHLTKLADVEKAAIARYKKAGSELQGQVRELESRRAALAGVIDADLLARYDQIREARGGIGVGKLEGNSCTACRMELPGERLRELRGGPVVATCPQCRRIILVIPSEEQE